MTPKRRWGVIRQTPLPQWSPIDFGRLRRDAMSDDGDWPVHSLMFSLHDLRSLHLRRIQSIVPCSMIFDSVSRRQIWPNHVYLQRLTVYIKSTWCPARILTCRNTNRSLYAPCMICQASFCSIFCQRFGFVSPDPQAASSCHIRSAILTRRVICSLFFVLKVINLFYHSTSSLVTA